MQVLLQMNQILTFNLGSYNTNMAPTTTDNLNGATQWNCLKNNNLVQLSFDQMML